MASGCKLHPGGLINCTEYKTKIQLYPIRVVLQSEKSDFPLPYLNTVLHVPAHLWKEHGGLAAF